MGLWLIRRVFQALLTVVAMSVIVFLGLNLVGSPADVLLAQESTMEERQRGLKDPGHKKTHY